MFRLTYTYGNPSVTVYVCTVPSREDAEKIAEYCEVTHLTRTKPDIEEVKADTSDFENFVTKSMNNTINELRVRSSWQHTWGREAILRGWEDFKKQLQDAKIREGQASKTKSLFKLKTAMLDIKNLEHSMKAIEKAYKYYTNHPEVGVK